jgi:hypothetical protein
MQDSILYMNLRSLKSYVSYLESYIPTDVQVNSSYNVVNTYANGEAYDPLFVIDII